MVYQFLETVGSQERKRMKFFLTGIISEKCDSLHLLSSQFILRTYIKLNSTFEQAKSEEYYFQIIVNIYGF